MPEIKTPEIAEIGKRKCKCRDCYKKIINKEPRLLKYGEYNRYLYKYYFCSDCGKKVIERDIKEMKEEITRLKKVSRELNKLKEKNKDIIILSQLENQNEKK